MHSLPDQVLFQCCLVSPWSANEEPNFLLYFLVMILLFFLYPALPFLGLTKFSFPFPEGGRTPDPCFFPNLTFCDSKKGHPKTDTTGNYTSGNAPPHPRPRTELLILWVGLLTKMLDPYPGNRALKTSSQCIAGISGNLTLTNWIYFAVFS